MLARHMQLLQRHDERRGSALLAALRLRQQGLQELARRHGRAQRALQQRAHERLDALQARLQALDPQRVLARGYAWVTDVQGRPIVSARGLSAGQQVRAVWADGEARATLDEVRTGTADAGR